MGLWKKKSQEMVGRSHVAPDLKAPCFFFLLISCMAMIHLLFMRQYDTLLTEDNDLHWDSLFALRGL